MIMPLMTMVFGIMLAACNNGDTYTYTVWMLPLISLTVLAATLVRCKMDIIATRNLQKPTSSGIKQMPLKTDPEINGLKTKFTVA